MHKHDLFGLLLVILTGCATATAPAAAPAPTPQPAAIPGIVTLSVFSGRPDPTWDLSPKQDQELRLQLAALAATTPGTFPETLGYRGISVQFFESNGSPHSVQIYGGRARIASGEQVAWLADPDRALELWLLDTGVMQNDDVAALEPSIRAEILGQP